MLSVNEATAIIAASGKSRVVASGALECEMLLGRGPFVLGEKLTADRPMPPFDRVAMDGIALSSRDWNEGCRVFRVSGLVRAGEAPKELEKPLECLEVMTGAVLPPHADAVVRYEDIEIVDGFAKVKDGVILKAYNNIHRAGADASLGQTICEPAVLFTPPLVAVAASIGLEAIRMAKTPRVAFVSTGDELVPVASRPKDFQIRQSNAYGIGAALGMLGVCTFERYHAIDQEGALRKVLELALETSDLVLVSGGVSAGKFDLVPKILGEIGIKRLFHKVNQRPGKPLWFGQSASGQRVFGLPGNPMSSLVSTYRYVLPMIQAEMLGCAIEALARPYARLKPQCQPLEFSSMTRFIPVSISHDQKGCTWATTVAHQGSGDYASLVRSDGFVEVAPQDQVSDPEMGFPFYSWQNVWN